MLLTPIKLQDSISFALIICLISPPKNKTAKPGNSLQSRNLKQNIIHHIQLKYWFSILKLMENHFLCVRLWDFYRNAKIMTNILLYFNNVSFVGVLLWKIKQHLASTTQNIQISTKHARKIRKTSKVFLSVANIRNIYYIYIFIVSLGKMWVEYYFIEFGEKLKTLVHKIMGK